MSIIKCLLGGHLFRPFVVFGLNSLGMFGVGAMSRASMLKLRVSALVATLSSSERWIGELESQLGLQNLEFDAAALELSSSERLLALQKLQLVSHGSELKVRGLGFV